MATRWENWSGSVRSRPEHVAAPGSADEIAEVVRGCREQGRRLRVVGSGHSFTPLVATDGTLVTLDRFQGIESTDARNGTVTVRAGTKLGALGKALLDRGLAQENLGDVDRQSLAGAIGTGTHGTGVELGSISTQVEAITVATADGHLVECSAAQRPDLLKAAQLSLGMVGVSALITLRVLPAYRLHYRTERRRLDDVLGDIDVLTRENRHFECYWFPNGDFVQAKVQNLTDAPPDRSGLGSALYEIVLENGALWLLFGASRLVPRLSRTVSRIIGRAVTTREGTDHSHRVFATRRWIRFQEMEYSVPVERFTEVIEDVRKTIRRRRFHVPMPIECRFVKGDDVWLSPAYGRDSAYVAVHMYRGMPYREYFEAMEEIFLRHDGRPHWGKMHWAGPETLRARYPRWDDFLRVRAELDPEGVFLNDYLEGLFGLSTRAE